MGFFQQQEDFADGEQAQHQHDELNAVSQMDVVPGETVHAAVGIDPDGRQKQADQRRDKGLQRSVTGHAAQADNREHHQHEIFRRSEGNRPFRQQRGEQHHAAGGDEGTDERTPRRQRQRHTGQAFAGHRVTVEGGHHGGGFARNVQQDRADPAAVFATQVHRRQQDQRRLRWQAEGERDRDQQRHAVDRAQARQQADDGADQGAAQRGHQVVRAQRDAEALTQIAKSIHISSPERRARPGAAARPSTCRTAGKDRSPSALMITHAGQPATAVQARHRNADQDARDDETERFEGARRTPATAPRRCRFWSGFRGPVGGSSVAVLDRCRDETPCTAAPRPISPSISSGKARGPTGS